MSSTNVGPFVKIIHFVLSATDFHRKTNELFSHFILTRTTWLEMVNMKVIHVTCS